MSAIEDMRIEITRLTGKQPKSRDVRYLERRLADLRKPVTVGVSMTQVQHAALHAIEDREGGGVAALIRRALGVYFADRGYTEAAVAFAGDNGGG